MGCRQAVKNRTLNPIFDSSNLSIPANFYSSESLNNDNSKKEKYYMNVSSRIALTTLVLAMVSLSVGCSGTPTATLTPQPVAPNGPISPTSNPTMVASSSPSNGPSMTPAPAPTGTSAAGTFCSAQMSSVPGTYTTIYSFGNVVGSTYSEAGGYGQWSAETVTATANPSAAPTPSTAPTTTPVPRAYYVYSGTYDVPSYSATPGPSGPAGPARTVAATNGCAVIIVTQDQKPSSPNATTNAISGETPIFNSAVSPSIFASGKTVTNITLMGTSGSGTILMDNGVTATVNLTSRTSTTLDRYKKFFAATHKV